MLGTMPTGRVPEQLPGASSEDDPRWEVQRQAAKGSKRHARVTGIIMAGGYIQMRL